MEKRRDLCSNIGDLAWLSSEHVTIKSTGSCKMLAVWLGLCKVLDKVVLLSARGQYMICPEH